MKHTILDTDWHAEEYTCWMLIHWDSCSQGAIVHIPRASTLHPSDIPQAIRSRWCR